MSLLDALLPWRRAAREHELIESLIVSTNNLRNFSNGAKGRPLEPLEQTRRDMLADDDDGR